MLSFGFGQLFKWAQRRGCHGPTVVAANYLCIAAALGVWLGVRGEGFPTGRALELGALTGVFFITAMLVFTQALCEASIGAVLTAFRVSILLPIVLGLWLWNEQVTRTEAAGVALSLVGLVLMTAGTREGVHERAGTLSTFALVFLVFFSQSLSHVGISSVHHLDLDGQMLEVLFAITLTAGVLGAAAIAYKRHKPTRAEITVGALIGLYNLVNLVTILLALSTVPRTIYFPVSGCSVVLLDNLCAHFYWKERLSMSALAGALLSAVAMLLVFVK